MAAIPPCVKPFLWSYDTSALDLERDKTRIITNVLNTGTRRATDWLFSVYDERDIQEAVAHPLPGEWSPRSLQYWSIVLGVTPAKRTRRIPA